jgi:endonuclease/exonuclease/phosphatase family metal-dependent hydrolase
MSLKKILIGFGLFVITGLIAFIVFFFWASQTTLDKDNYDFLRDNRRSSVELGDTISVMTFNVGYMSGMTNNSNQERSYELFEDNLNNCIQLLRKYHPNIIGFQEIDVSSDRSYYQNQLDSLEYYVWYRTHYRSVNWDRRYVPFPYWPPSAHFKSIISGQGILTDYEITNAQNIVLERPDIGFLREAFYLDRLLQVVDINTRKGPVKVMNVHLEAFDAETRLKQAQVVKRIYELYADRMPVILMGDFNSELPGEINSDAIELILSAKKISSLIDPKEYEMNPELYYTFSSRNPERMIDFVFYNTNYFKKIEGSVLREAEEISDHLPLYGKLHLYRQNTFF